MFAAKVLLIKTRKEEMKVDLSRVIEQLESIKENSKRFITPDEPVSIWRDDVIALDEAIKRIKKHIDTER